MGVAGEMGPVRVSAPRWDWIGSVGGARLCSLTPQQGGPRGASCEALPVPFWDTGELVGR